MNFCWNTKKNPKVFSEDFLKNTGTTFQGILKGFFKRKF